MRKVFYFLELPTQNDIDLLKYAFDAHSPSALMNPGP